MDAVRGGGGGRRGLLGVLEEEHGIGFRFVLILRRTLGDNGGLYVGHSEILAKSDLRAAELTVS